MDFQLTASASICDERSTSFHRIFNYAPVTFFHFDLLRSVLKAKKFTFRRPKNYSFLKWRKRNLSFPERCKPFCPALGLLPVERIQTLLENPLQTRLLASHSLTRELHFRFSFLTSVFLSYPPHYPPPYPASGSFSLPYLIFSYWYRDSILHGLGAQRGISKIKS